MKMEPIDVHVIFSYYFFIDIHNFDLIILVPLGIQLQHLPSTNHDFSSKLF